MNSFFSDEEKVAKFVMALEPMKPSWSRGGATAQMAASTIQNAREDRKIEKSANRTLEFLRAKGVPENVLKAAEGNPEVLRAMVSQVLAKPKDQFKTLTGADLGLSGEQATRLFKQNTATNEVSAIGGVGNTTQIISEQEKELDKTLGKGVGIFINDLASGLPAARDQANQVQSLQALSLAMDTDVADLPGPIRGLIPEGVVPSVDAYRSQMLGVAQGLRTAGTGAQSERDMDLLIARAGSIASDPKARTIAHKALAEKAERDLRAGQIARQIQLSQDPKERADLQSQLTQIYDAPLLSDDMRQSIISLQEDVDMDALEAEMKRRGLL